MKNLSSRLASIGLPLLLLAVLPAAAGAAPLAGAIFTSAIGCGGTNVNIFDDKADVYLDGGPAHPGAAGLPDGSYYVQVTTPEGAVLGTSVGSGNETPVVVSGGEFAACYQLAAILIRHDATPGYDDTTNAGGVYKVWVSTEGSFTNSNTKTDNFKVKPHPAPPMLHVRKFYDVNANGLKDGNEVYLDGWQVHIQDDIDLVRETPVDIIVDPDTYTVSEFMPQQNNWVATTPSPVLVTLAPADDTTVSFGNVCLGGGGGHTLGFWSNKNGQAQMNDGNTMAPELSMLVALNLRNANGSDYDPSSYNGFRNWLLSADATNMAYMLSAQLAAMELNVEAGFVDGSGLIYIPNVGFFSVNSVMASANAALGTNGLTTAGSPDRGTQEILKNALDAANNNQNFVQATACPYTF